jgi:hypothetical protein
MVTVVVPEMVFVVLPPWLSKLAAPLPLLVIAKEMVADGFTVIVMLAVPPCRIGFCDGEPIVTAGMTVSPPPGVKRVLGQGYVCPPAISRFAHVLEFVDPTAWPVCVP